MLSSHHSPNAPATLCWLALLIFCLSGPARADDSATKDSLKTEEISQWIEDLASDSYLRRKRATHDLMATGQAAVGPLMSILDNGELETTNRVISILQEIAINEPLATSGPQQQEPNADAGSQSSTKQSPSAWNALQEIATLGGARGARAKVAAAEVRDIRRAQAIEMLKSAGALIGITEFVVGARSDLKRIVHLDERFRADDVPLSLFQWIDGIRYARVKGPAINHEVLAAVTQMPELQTLSLVEGEIDRQTLQTIGGMLSLRNLEFRYVPLSAELVDDLATLPIRVSLTLSGTDAPADRVDALQEAMPGLHIDFKRGGFLGVTCFDNANECLINDVQPGSAAQAAGLQGRDVIIQVDDRPIQRFKDLQAAINSHNPGESIKIRFRRGEMIQETTATLGRLREVR